MALFAEHAGAKDVWDRYCNQVAQPTERDRRVSYARVVADDGVVVLQYWQFYRYNDWWNHHEADWELVSIFLASDDRDATPFAVAYSAHLGGYWRLWGAVEKDAGSHPVVYVARGSHAQYFVATSRGYRAVLDQSWDLFLFRGRFRLTGERDVVARLARESQTCPYKLEHIPDRWSALAPSDPEWSRWWWLQYRGGWGHPDWILGPALQGRKWTNPVAWVGTDCLADTGVWDDIVSAAATRSLP
jgi:hypothetical protein